MKKNLETYPKILDWVFDNNSGINLMNFGKISNTQNVKHN
jgi:hypothetical protein